jgi:xanthine dehydrogenase YagR molybdenum-binding subunit
MADNQARTTSTPTWGSNNQHRLLNKRIPRVDGPAKASGAAKYTYDVRLPNMLIGRILRCPHARATVTSFDTSDAEKIPGVRGVIAGGNNLHYEGDPVAAVAADTTEIADDAIRAIKVQYNLSPHAVSFEAATAPDAPSVQRDPGGQPISNIELRNRKGSEQRAQTALAECDVTVDVEYRTPILHHACLETHGVVVDYSGGDSATVYASTQGTFSIPNDAARALDLPGGAVTAIVQYMGGGFGSKFGIGAEGNFACRLSKRLGRPVKFMLTRHDEFVTAGNGSGSVQRIKAGATKDGKLHAFVAKQFCRGGMGGGSLSDLPYIYHARTVYNELSSVRTNEDSSRAMRAPGHPPACYAMESMMDELADKLGMDPLEFRKRNVDDVHVRQLTRGAKEIGWDQRKPNGQWPGTLKRGFGCAVANWGGGGGKQCIVNVDIKTDGSVTVSCGTQDLGTGTRTYLRAIVAEELGLELDDVVEKIGDSRLGNANASGGSSTAPSLSPAVKDAAFNARIAVANRVAQTLGVDPGAVTFADGAVAAGTKKLSWKQACATLPTAGISARGEWQPGLSTGGVHGVCFAEVEVDTETGYVRPIKMVLVQDCGLPLNRLAVESQINGGMIQGIGMALYEGRVMDETLGAMINAGFGDYKIPGSLEMPELVPLIDDDDVRQAVIGVGEPPSIPGAAAVANAVANAAGVRVRDTPITPDKILMALMA